MIESVRYFHSSSLGGLEQMMPELIADGWQPFGSISVGLSSNGWDYYQTMIKGTEGTLPSNQAVVTDSTTYPLYGSDGATNQNTTVSPVIASGILSRFKLATGYTALANAVAVAVRNSAGANSHSGTSVVTTAGALTGVNLPATTAMIDNGDAVTMQNSAGTAIAGTHPATVSSGVISNVKLAATIAPVANASVQASVPVTNNAILAIGTVNRQVTYTVANGVVTGLTIV